MLKDKYPAFNTEPISRLERTPIKKVADLKLSTIFESVKKTKKSISVEKQTHMQFSKRDKTRSNNSSVNAKPIDRLVRPFDNTRLNILTKNLKNFRAKATSNDCVRNKDKLGKPKIPQSIITPESVINKYKSLLHDIEIDELNSIKEIYYLGDIAKRDTMKTDLVDDDENGNLIIRKKAQLNYRYEIVSELGQGSFGQAVKCYDHKTKSNVCIKIVKSKKKFTHQAKIEISVLEHIAKHNTKDEANIVKMISHFMFRKHIVYIYLTSV